MRLVIPRSNMCSYFCLILFLYFTSNGILCTWQSTLSDSLSKLKTYLPVNIGPEDAYLTINELALKYEYPLENHSVVTEDGYILNMHRIPYSRKRVSNGKVVFLMHGLSDTSDSWLLQGPDNALAYILADNGYDVWMGNERGNKHSNKHKSLNVNMSSYWTFSWEEIGLFDLTAMIDYTLKVTGQKSLNYVGNSQGTTAFFALLSMKPEYNSKIEMMFGLAPEAFMSNAKSPLFKILSPAKDYIQSILSYFDIYAPSEKLFTTISPLICNVIVNECHNFFYAILGPNNVNESMWPIILGHSPSGASTFEYLHYAQLAKSKKFRRYDYGKVKNRQKYGRDCPPVYKLNQITCPIILFYGGKDWFSDKIDVEKLIEFLPNVQKTYFIKDFGHSDFIYADEAKDLIYVNILKHLN